MRENKYELLQDVKTVQKGIGKSQLLQKLFLNLAVLGGKGNQFIVYLCPAAQIQE